MRTLGAVLLVVLLAAVMVAPATGQVPVVRVYFDDQFECWEARCPEGPVGTVQDSLYVVASGFTSTITSLQYSVDYPPSIGWLSDVFVSGKAFGSTPTGIRHHWSTPMDASDNLLVATVQFVWFCECCNDINDYVCVVGYPATGRLVADDSEDHHRIYASGLGAVICPVMCQAVPLCWSPPTPVQLSTWGKIKALFDTPLARRAAETPGNDPRLESLCE